MRYWIIPVVIAAVVGLLVAYRMTGTSIEGGETFHLSKGDVITIPAKTPHWWKEISTKTVSYYAVNIESK